jgi:hypothetical protein
MILFFSLFFTALIPAHASAYTVAELEYRNKTLHEFNQLFGQIDYLTDQSLSNRTGPVCDEFQRAFHAIKRHQPPKSCAKTESIFQHYIKSIDRKTENCRSIERLLNFIEPGDSCYASPEAWQRKRTEFNEIIRNKPNDEEKEPQFDSELESANSESPTGEMRNMDCALSLMIVLQGEKKIQSLLNKYRGGVDFYFYEPCEEKTLNRL